MNSINCKQSLSFAVSVAKNELDFEMARKVRAQAYSRHQPLLFDQLLSQDPLDYSKSTTVILSKDKITQEATGTARLQRNSFGKLLLQNSVDLPYFLSTSSLVEVTRLAINKNADKSTRLALMKACYLFCLATQSNWIVLGARSDSLVRIYRSLGFQDVFHSNKLIELEYAGGLPHRILCLDVCAAEKTWRLQNHKLFPFMIETLHPDIDIPFHELNLNLKYK